ncbi:DUF397 domain-containing protein [Kitasatospora sp. NPDC004272]
MTLIDLPHARWVKSSHSSDGGNCVEFAPEFTATHGLVPVRDSKDPQGPTLLFSTAGFAAFVAAARSGQFGEI